MARKSKDELAQERVNAVVNIVKQAESSTEIIRNRWRENYDMFAYGTTFEDKQDWQTSFSINKVGSAIRVSAGRMRDVLLDSSEWYSLEPRNKDNQEAATLAPIFKKLLDYYLECADFGTYVSTFILCSLIDMGSMVVGWKTKLVPNPAYVAKRTKDAVASEQEALAEVVENPSVEPPGAGMDIQRSIEAALSRLDAEMFDKPLPEPEVKPYIAIGGLQFETPNAQLVGWDPSVQYLKDSRMKWYRTVLPLWQVRELAKHGFYDKKQVAKIEKGGGVSARTSVQNIRYKNTQQDKRGEMVELLVYFGPLIVDNEVKEPHWHCVIANESIEIKSGEYPYWEPPGHHTPIVNNVVREVPHRATGAGIGDNAVKLNRTYDSTWNLIADQARLGVAGLLVVNYQDIIDKSFLEEGIEPGKPIEVRGNPKEVVHFESMTSNIENQVMPVQEAIRQGIQEQLGVPDVFAGAPNLRSRTTAAETNAQVSGGERAVNDLAVDTERNGLVPILQKAFARVLQFGLPDVLNNPEIKGVLNPEEIDVLLQIGEEKRMEILNQYYRFKIKGFSHQADKAEKLRLFNEMLSIMNSGGPLSQLINVHEFVKTWLQLMDIDEENKLLVVDDQLSLISSENQFLAMGRFVPVGMDDNHELHIRNQQMLQMNEAVMMHLQQHQQAIQMMQMQQQQQQQGLPPGQPQRALPQ